MKHTVRISFLYAIFAVRANLTNLGSQALTIRRYQCFNFVDISILAGTAIGLLLKYILDKRHIYGFKTDSPTYDGLLFFLFSLMGVFTTMMFCGVEYSFHELFGTDTMLYLVGAIGLTLGYYIKYCLDKRLVFSNRATAIVGTF